MIDRIIGAGAALGVDLDSDTARRLEALARLIARWNQRIRLVGPSDLETIVDAHIVDGLGFVRTVAKVDAEAWWDIGAGAGLPGLVLALCLPHKRFELVEPVGKKSAFITHACVQLKIGNVGVHPTRIEFLAPSGPRAALSRATFAPDEWVSRAAALVGSGGTVLVALGHADAPELRDRAVLVDEYRLPASGAARTNLVVRVP